MTTTMIQYGWRRQMGDTPTNLVGISLCRNKLRSIKISARFDIKPFLSSSLSQYGGYTLENCLSKRAEGGAVSTPSSLIQTTATLHPLDSSPALAILFACLVLLFIAIVLLCIRRVNPNSFDEALGLHFLRHRRPQIVNTKGLDSTVIKSFAIFAYSDVRKALKIGKSVLECAVCLNEFEDGEFLRLLPNCCHVFHPECIDAWLAFRTTCPVCRACLENKTKPGELKKPVHENSVPAERSEAVIDIHTNSLLTQKTTKSMHLPSLIQPGENCDKFTLRLADDIRKQMVDLSLSHKIS
ncbi:hypothetical protein HAX54_014935 [Datura stramonium]|uniref:RING-type E3 ubiquitin transferase n=1 Tax=Datura stramonium TaxID=4076 RepID=A0ABS8TQS7_DATST|nr:hypothetical protein [Datura stramonium]